MQNSKGSLSKAEAAAELLERKKARSSLLAWCMTALTPSGLKPAKHHLLLIRALDRLAIFLPPGSAKTTYSSHLFPPYFMSLYPGSSIIGASATGEFAEKVSRRVQGYVRDNRTVLGFDLARESAAQWDTTNGCEYKAAGVGGNIQGTRADLAIVDDPVPGRKEAESEGFREDSWDWFNADLMGRLKPGGRIIVIQTRWHEDDLSGRILSTQGDKWEVICIPATAREGDPLGRKPGEMLWANDPDYAYADNLLIKKADLEKAGAMRDWYALYEQDPRPLDGGIFQTGRLTIVDAPPPLRRTIRGWDLAATAQTGTRDPDWTVGLKMGQTEDGRYVVLDVKRFRGGPAEVLDGILSTAKADGKGVRIGLPQDPGQAGKAQVQYMTQRLAGFPVISSPESGDKAERAMPFASQVNAGNVLLVRAGWNAPYVEELRGFPSSAKDDQVDAGSRAFNTLVATPGPIRRVALPFMGR
jgi:predicted phage terminase large subunit-like protein